MLYLGNGDRLGFADRDATLAAAAFVRIAYHNAVAFLLIDLHWANADAFTADLAFLLINYNDVHDFNNSLSGCSKRRSQGVGGPGLLRD
jgi:hypothetical protein